MNNKHCKETARKAIELIKSARFNKKVHIAIAWELQGKDERGKDLWACVVSRTKDPRNFLKRMSWEHKDNKRLMDFLTEKGKKKEPTLKHQQRGFGHISFAPDNSMMVSLREDPDEAQKIPMSEAKFKTILKSYFTRRYKKAAPARIRFKPLKNEEIEAFEESEDELPPELSNVQDDLIKQEWGEDPDEGDDSDSETYEMVEAADHDDEIADETDDEDEDLVHIEKKDAEREKYAALPDDLWATLEREALRIVKIERAGRESDGFDAGIDESELFDRIFNILANCVMRLSPERRAAGLANCVARCQLALTYAENLSYVPRVKLLAERGAEGTEIAGEEDADPYDPFSKVSGEPLEEEDLQAYKKQLVRTLLREGRDKVAAIPLPYRRRDATPVEIWKSVDTECGKVTGSKATLDTLEKLAKLIRTGFEMKDPQYKQLLHWLSLGKLHKLHYMSEPDLVAQLFQLGRAMAEERKLPYDLETATDRKIAAAVRERWPEEATDIKADDAATILAIDAVRDAVLAEFALDDDLAAYLGLRESGSDLGDRDVQVAAALGALAHLSDMAEQISANVMNMAEDHLEETRKIFYAERRARYQAEDRQLTAEEAAEENTPWTVESLQGSWKNYLDAVAATKWPDLRERVAALKDVAPERLVPSIDEVIGRIDDKFVYLDNRFIGLIDDNPFPQSRKGIRTVIETGLNSARHALLALRAAQSKQEAA